MKKGFLDKMKGYIGIFLIILAIGIIFVWETYGREKLLYVDQVVFKEDTPANTKITSDNLMILPVERSKIISDPISDVDQVIGKETKIFIPKNAPLHKSYFDNPDVVLDKDQYIFPIPNDWIKAFPDTIRRKDTIYIYEYKEEKKISVEIEKTQTPQKDTLGIKAYSGSSSEAIKQVENKAPIIKFAVAYVKDGTNREVKDSGTIERQDGTSNIQKIEIIGTTEQFKQLEDSYKKGNKFIIMYK